MQNTEYEKEFVFDIDAYLIDSYPKMNMSTRRAVCTMALDEWLDEKDLYDTIDGAVAQYACTQLELTKKEDEEEED